MSDEPKNWVPDWAWDWGKVPFDPNAERAAFNATANGPRPMSPPQDSKVSPPNPPGSGTGWQAERGLQPQPGIDLIDRICINADQRERAQAQQPDLMQVLLQQQEQQTKILALLAQILTNKEAAKASPDQPKAKGKTP
jgi:hypothetical protein